MSNSAEIEMLRATISKLTLYIAIQRRVIKRLRVIDRDFAWHYEECSSIVEEDSDGNGEPCNCGLDWIRDEIAAIEKQKAIG